MSETDRRRALPSVDRLLAHPALAAAALRWSRRTLLAVLRDELDLARAEVAAGAAVPDADDVAAACAVRCERLGHDRPRRVVNATGVVVHTNLGRSPLSDAARTALASVAEGYSDLEYDLAAGTRGSRHAHVAEALRLLFPGTGALCVNNNAAALLLALNTFALGREVVVSRGELVEIGGSFRVPEILERSGARLREVGTTNRTHLKDYVAAVGAQTGLILKVWPSNYRVVGFTADVGTAELARLARERGIPLVVDQGCGRLFRDAPGPESEESVDALLEAGAGLVCFSGDKMLGGPQCGVIVGAPDLVSACAKNPLARALRPGKLTLAALGATLRGWMSAQPGDVPVARMLSVGHDDLRAEADALLAEIRRAAPGVDAHVLAAVSRVGGGAAPEEDLPTFVVAVTAPGLGEDTLLSRLRRADPPVVARAHDGAVLFDPRTLTRDEFPLVASALAAALSW